MPRARTIYGVEALYVGPAPSTGYHFVNNAGTFNSDYTNTNTNYNLVKSIYRVQSINYGFNTNYINIGHLGKDANIHRCSNYPTVNLDFSYLQQGVINELRCGFYANYTQWEGNVSGQSYYLNNTGVNILSGFLTRTLEPGSNDFHYPYSYRDKRNFFIAVAGEGIDINPKSYAEVHKDPTTFNVIGIGNCYLTKYQSQGSVGSFAISNLSYIGENLVVYNSGSGVLVPAVNYVDGTPITNQRFNIPADYQGTGVCTTIRPGDISVTITSLPRITGSLVIPGTGYTQGSYLDIYNLGFSYSDSKVQSYNLEMDLRRDSIAALNTKLPIDRPIQFPVIVPFSFSTIIGDTQTGSLDTLLSKNDDYNITIQLKNPKNTPQAPREIAVQYDFIRAKLDSISYTNQIGGQKVGNFNFSTEIDTDNYNQGFFMSGLINVIPSNTITGFLLKEDGGFLLKEDGSKLILFQSSILY